MNKKLIIQIVVIVIAFGASGIVLYNGFFKNGSSQPALGSAQTSAGDQSQAILPYGSTLDFSILKKQDLQFGTVQYPKVDPALVGIPENQLIKPIAP